MFHFKKWKKKRKKRIEYIVRYATTIIINAQLMQKYVVLYTNAIIINVY